MELFWIRDCLIKNSIAHLGNVADLGNWSGLTVHIDEVILGRQQTLIKSS